MVVRCFDLARVELIIHGLDGMTQLVVVEHYHIEDESSDEAIHLAEIRGVIANLVVLGASCDIQNEVDGC